MQELVEYAKMIEDSLSSITKKDVEVLLTANKPELTPLILAYKTMAVVQPAVCNHAPLTSTCANIGKTILVGLEDEELPQEQTIVTRVNVGYFLLNVLFEANKLEIRKGKNERDPYTLAVKDDAFIDAMLYAINAEPLPIQVHTKPIFEEPIPYKGFYHPVAGELVHKCNPDAREYFTYERSPKVFDAINKHMKTPYKVNIEVLDILQACKKDDILSFRDKAKSVDNDTWKEQFVGLKREQTAIFDIAEGIGDRRFWQYMFYDFRGRLYSSLTYFSPQGSKLAKSLFRFANEKPLGEEGWFWLLVHTANCRGWDKFSIEERYEKASHNLDAWMKIAKDPVNNKQWQCADSPFEFLAAIVEIHKAIESDDIFGFESGAMVAWDATCSGLQVLSAITRDKEAGKLCNLANTGERGDYYNMIAEHIWPETAYNEHDVTIFEEVVAQLSAFDARIFVASKNAKSEIYAERREWIEENRDNVRIASRVFWGRPEIKALKRKIVKRPCMTYFYSCQPKTMAKSLLSDFRNDPKFEGIQLTFCLWLTHRIYKACQELMPIATQMMDAFVKMGIQDFKANKDFSLEGPFNGFIFMQNYRNPLTKPVQFKYKGQRIRLKVMIGRGEKIDYKKVSSANSPNCVHMLDGQIVSATVLYADYDINCVHDSFATLPADAGKLYEDVRTCFVGIFDRELLRRIESEKNFDSGIVLGDLDLDDTLRRRVLFLII